MTMNTVPPADLLAGRRALIAGGTGNVGRYIVDAFLAAGAVVVVPSRSAEKLQVLRRHLSHDPGDRLVTFVGDLGSEAGAAHVKDEVLERTGGVDAVVASLGDFVPAPSLLEAPVRDLERALEGYLIAHFLAARTLIPVIRGERGGYVFINGPLAFDPLFPGSGLVSTVTAAQAMLARALMKELESTGPRVNELVIHTSFGWGDREERGSNRVSREDVGRYLVYLSSEHGVDIRGETIHLDSLEPLLELAGGTASRA